MQRVRGYGRVVWAGALAWCAFVLWMLWPSRADALELTKWHAVDETVFPVGATGREPRLASSGSGWLMAHLGYDPPRIVLTHIRPDGTPVWPTRELFAAIPPGPPDLVFDGDGYWVAWAESQLTGGSALVRAQRLDLEGVPVGEPLTLGSAAAAPDVRLTAHAGQTLAAWCNHIAQPGPQQTQCVAVRLNHCGVVGSTPLAIDGPWPNAGPPISGYSYLRTAGSSAGWLLLLHRSPGLQAVRIGLDGALLDEVPFAVASTNHPPSAVGADSGWLVAYSSSNGMQLASISGTGQVAILPAPVLPPTGGPASQTPQLLRAPGGFSILGASDSGTYQRLLDANYAPRGEVSQLFTAYIARYPDGTIPVAVAWSETQSLVVWKGEGNWIQSQRTTVDGTPLWDGSAQVVSIKANDQVQHSVTLGGDGYLVSWWDNRSFPDDFGNVDGETFVRIFDRSGEPASAPFSLEPALWSRPVFSGGESSWLAAWFEDDGLPKATLVGPGGSSSTAPLTLGSGEARALSLSNGNDSWLVAWFASTNPGDGSGAILARRVGFEGALIDTQPIPLWAGAAPPEANGVDIHVTRGSHSWLVSWAIAPLPSANDYSALAGRRIGFDGALIDQQPIPLTPADARGVAVEANTQSFWLTWLDRGGTRRARSFDQASAQLSEPVEIIPATEGAKLTQFAAADSAQATLYVNSNLPGTRYRRLVANAEVQLLASSNPGPSAWVFNRPIAMTSLGSDLLAAFSNENAIQIATASGALPLTVRASFPSPISTVTLTRGGSDEAMLGRETSVRAGGSFGKRVYLRRLKSISDPSVTIDASGLPPDNAPTLPGECAAGGAGGAGGADGAAGAPDGIGGAGGAGGPLDAGAGGRDDAGGGDGNASGAGGASTEPPPGGASNEGGVAGSGLGGSSTPRGGAFTRGGTASTSGGRGSSGGQPSGGSQGPGGSGDDGCSCRLGASSTTNSALSWVLALFLVACRVSRRRAAW